MGAFCVWCLKLSSGHSIGGGDVCCGFMDTLQQTGYHVSLFCLFTSWSLDPFRWWCWEVTGLRWIPEGEAWDRIRCLTRGIKHQSSGTASPRRAGLACLCAPSLSVASCPSWWRRVRAKNCKIERFLWCHKSVMVVIWVWNPPTCSYAWALHIEGYVLVKACQRPCLLLPGPG